MHSSMLNCHDMPNCPVLNRHTVKTMEMCMCSVKNKHFDTIVAFVIQSGQVL